MLVILYEILMMLLHVGKYYVVNAGYPNCLGYLAPDKRGITYLSGIEVWNQILQKRSSTGYIHLFVTLLSAHLEY